MSPGFARAGAVTALAAVAVLGTAAPAGAHVLVEPSTTAAGALAVLTVTVPHGCDGSPTTAITILVPDGVDPVTPSAGPQWTIEESAGRPLTVTYRAAVPLPDDERGVVELGLRLPDAEGTVLVFPTVQTCGSGEVAWIEVPAPGQDADELARPAPAVTVTAGSASRPAPAQAGPAVPPGSPSGGTVDAASSGAATSEASGGAAPPAIREAAPAAPGGAASAKSGGAAPEESGSGAGLTAAGVGTGLLGAGLAVTLAAVAIVLRRHRRA